MKTNTLNKDEHNGMEIKICKTCKKKLGMFAKNFKEDLKQRLAKLKEKT